MSRFDIQNFMRKLSVVPGLSFLDRWLMEYNTTNTRIGQRVGDLQTYYRRVNEAGAEVRGVMGGNAGSLDPDVDETGKYVGGEDDDSSSDFSNYDAASNTSNQQDVDALSQNYEDVFYDDDT